MYFILTFWIFDLIDTVIDHMESFKKKKNIIFEMLIVSCIFERENSLLKNFIEEINSRDMSRKHFNSSNK
jgi:hypothetical protein